VSPELQQAARKAAEYPTAEQARAAGATIPARCWDEFTRGHLAVTQIADRFKVFHHQARRGT